MSTPTTNPMRIWVVSDGKCQARCVFTAGLFVAAAVLSGNLRVRACVSQIFALHCCNVSNSSGLQRVRH